VQLSAPDSVAQQAEWLDGLEHQPDSGVSQDLGSGVSLEAFGLDVLQQPEPLSGDRINVAERGPLHQGLRAGS
jgi:hypothetical protein